MDILQYLGKFHPIILHLPIGFLLLAFMMEVYGRWKKSQQFQAAIGFALFWGMIGATFAAASGYLLSLDGGYEAELLSWHQWTGIGVAALSIILYWLHRQHIRHHNSLYFPVFSLLTIALTAAGHFGGSLTHGTDFLSPNAPTKNAKKELVDIENAQVFEDLIQPILKDKCVRCHSTSKTKGDLLMATIEGLQKGGETGALFVKGDVDNSLMLQRVHLPLEEKEHMPPKGKQQLLSDEIALLTWWIKEGADFTAKVKEVPRDEKMDAILKKFVVPSDDVSNIKVAKVGDGALQKIKAAGIPVFRLAKDNSFVEVDLSRKKNIDKNTLKQLKPIAEQLVWLNLSNTDIKDEDLSYVANFPHLQKLFLQQTAISDKGLKNLLKLDYLSYLNLYQTKVTDEGLGTLSQLKRLQKLYLWKTATTKEGIAKFINQKPKTVVNTGIDKAIFGDASLKAPMIVAENDLFKDSIRVALKMNFNKVAIYYTLDGTTPDSTSKLYTTPFLLTQSTMVKSIAQKKGWTSSGVATKQFASVKYTPTSIRLKKPPSEKYSGNGAPSLIDLQKGSTTFSDGQWLGFEKEHATATMDLGELVAVSGVTIGALEATSSYIFYPKGLQVSVSADGKKYKTIATEKYSTTAVSKPNEISNFTANFDTQMARFVRVKIESHLVNPAWHPAPGAPCWLFIDEIAVE